MKKEKISGYVIYEGKSRINGKDIVAIVTMESSNVKTGNMASMWILNADESPIEASKSGNDDSVCGMCPHRHNLGGSCYVTLFQAPLQVWKSYKKGKYPVLYNMDIFNGMSVRFGAYGDPYAIPMDILNSIKAVVKNNTSYTHQWNNDNVDNSILKKVSMASVDSIEEAKIAQNNGWRTFRVTKNEDILMENEIICPNYTNDVKCIDCRLCSGASIKAKNIVIPIHGSKKNKFVEEVSEMELV
jgi:hypothetical protein